MENYRILYQRYREYGLNHPPKATSESGSQSSDTAEYGINKIVLSGQNILRFFQRKFGSLG